MVAATGAKSRASSIARVVVTLLLIVLVVLLVLFAVWPVPVKPLLKRAFPTPTYEPSAAMTVLGPYSAFYGDVTLRKANLVVIVVGGSFLLSNLATHYGFVNALHDRIGDRFDALLVSYPTRFRNTIRDMMLSINESVAQHAGQPSSVDGKRNAYRAYHAIGFSAGALLAGTYERKERDDKYANEIQVPRIGAPLTTFVTVCGLLVPSFDVSLYDAIYRLYIARGTPNWDRYSCYGMQIPRLVVTASSDLLADQSVRYLSSQAAEDLAFREPPKLPHTFAQNMDLPQAKQVVERVAKFLSKNAA